MLTALRAVRPAWMPVTVLVVAAVLAAGDWRLPAGLAGLREAGPYAVLAIAIAVAGWFNRARALVFAATLLVAHAGLQLAQAAGGFAPHAVVTVVALVVPLNVLAALLLEERGVAHHRNYRWLLALLAQVLLAAWIASAGRSAFSGAAWMAMLDHWTLRSPPTPWLARIAFAAAFAAALWRAWPRQSPLECGIAGALVATFVACEWIDRPGVAAAFLSAAGALLVISVLQESHRMAFNDELTGLPGRRALMESLAALGPRYVVAMADVDHFKKFNDTHGHDIGDQVLKLVAARLAEVRGGGRAFRYGGEEFTVLFPNHSLEEALPHLEAVRAAIEHYPMAVRAPDRPKDAEEGERRRAEAEPGRTLSVTVSLGVAEPDAKRHTPPQVLKAADQALYRAKQGGRNRVST